MFVWYHYAEICIIPVSKQKLIGEIKLFLPREKVPQRWQHILPFADVKTLQVCLNQNQAF